MGVFVRETISIPIAFWLLIPIQEAEVVFPVYAARSYDYDATEILY